MQKPKIILARVFHRNMEIMTVSFDKNDAILRCLKTLPHLTWSQTHKAWYLPFSSSLQPTLFRLLSSLAYIDYSALKRQELTPAHVGLSSEKIKQAGAPSPLGNLTPEHEEKMKRFRSWMLSRRYSGSTINTYADALSVFLRYFNWKKPEEINNEDLIHFNTQYILANHCSASYQNQVVNAVKLFFRTLESRQLNPDLVHRPKRSKTLPNVLSKEEVKQILMASGNVKHRAMLCLMYSCGLRCGELIRLKPEHIDANRKLLIVKQSKGRKDRIVPLSEKIIDLLRKYHQAFRPVNYLFEGQKTGEMYDERSLQQVLKKSVSKAGVSKPVTLHWLRHSYATHLLENGTDLRYIQEILGHSSSRTTEIYTHVSNKSIQKIISPFDYL